VCAAFRRLRGDGRRRRPQRGGAARIASEHNPVVADVTKPDACKAVSDKAAALGKITGLLNSAGIELHGSVVEMPEEDWDKVFAVNLKAIYLLSKHVIPHMIANGSGSVVNMSSIQALATQAGVAAYAATKGAVLSLTRVMALAARTTASPHLPRHDRDAAGTPTRGTGTRRTRPQSSPNGRQACAEPDQPADQGGALATFRSPRSSFIPGRTWSTGADGCSDRQQALA
jgi:NAD(P)-dependent dehydrogenase (short-subunit alcohol dehydrogenase family)